MVGWHHQVNEPKFEQTLGVGDGQGRLACCSPWGCKESDTLERLKNLCVPSPSQTSPRSLLWCCPKVLPVRPWFFYFTCMELPHMKSLSCSEAVVMANFMSQKYYCFKMCPDFGQTLFWMFLWRCFFGYWHLNWWTLTKADYLPQCGGLHSIKWRPV